MCLQYNTSKQIDQQCSVVETVVEPVEKLCDEVEMVNAFCYSGDRLDAHGGCETGLLR